MIQREISLFISYRRGDVPDAARLVHEIFAQRFGDEFVFWDNDMAVGAEYPAHLTAKLNNCNVVVAIIGPSWERGADGLRDITQPNDWVHRELKVAQQRGMDILPLVIDRDPPVAFPAGLEALNVIQQARLTSAQLTSQRELAQLYAVLDDLAARHARKPLVFISSTLTYTGSRSGMDGLDYFTNLLTRVVKALNTERHDVILKVPEFSSSAPSSEVTAMQERALDDVLSNSQAYKGVVIAPYQVAPIRKRIEHFRAEELQATATFMGARSPFPIAAIDKGFAYDADRADLATLAPVFSVENDAAFNGARAADCLVEYLRRAQIAVSNVSVLVGREGSGPRVTGFKRRISRLLKESANAGLNILIRDSEEMNFTQEDGRANAEQFLDARNISEKFGPERPAQIHAFFGCNDELALGARLALLNQRALGRGRSPHPTVVIGFDGIRDVTRLLDLDHEPVMLNTIETLVDAQVAELVRLLTDWLKRRPSAVPCKFVKLPGRRYLNGAEQEARADRIAQVHRAWPS